MTQKRQRGAAKRAQVAKAGRKLFLTRGFGATSMNEIARAAGVSKETLYAHFPAKEAVLEAALGELLDLGPFETPGAAEPGPAVEELGGLERALLTYAGVLVKELMQPEYLALLRVVVSEAGRLPGLGEAFRGAVARRALGGVVSLLERARSAGVVAVADPELAARMFVGPLLTWVLLEGLLRGSRRGPGPGQLRRIVTQFLHGSIGAPKGKR